MNKHLKYFLVGITVVGIGIGFVALAVKHPILIYTLLGSGSVYIHGAIFTEWFDL